jgi:hypothetical protein
MSASGTSRYFAASRNLVLSEYSGLRQAVRPPNVGGTIVYREVTADETRTVMPGETVELPLAEIKRLTELGFVERSDGKFMTHTDASISNPRL